MIFDYIPGNKSPVAADRVNNRSYQLVKLVDATTDSDDAIGTSENPMPVSTTTVKRTLVGSAAHGQALTANTVLTVPIGAHAEEVEVTIADGNAPTAPIFVRVDGGDPVVNGVLAEVLPAGVASSLTLDVIATGNTIVKLISTSSKPGGISVVGRA